MTIQKTKERIAFLSSEIKRHKDLYTSGKPEISDEDYDRLEEELKKLDTLNPVLKTVGGSVESFRSRVSHSVPMLSLDKTYDLDDLGRWIAGRPVIGLAKLDGSSVSLVYVNGELSVAKTRGDGIQGEDITKKLLTMATNSILPAKILSAPLVGKSFEVRGEIFCTGSSFGLLSEDMVTLGLDKPSSVRNIVAGLLARKDHDQLTKHLSFSGFSLLLVGDSKTDESIKYESGILDALKASGFTAPIYRKIEDKDGVDEFLSQIKTLMGDGEFPIDGAVFALNERSLQKELGETTHHPRYKMAFKWKGETARATIQRIEWFTSKDGLVTPVAVISPVELSGATITNVTLHNFSYVKRLVLKAGDEIEVVRSGEVIPKFLSVLKSLPGAPGLPSECPSCSGALEDDGVRLICRNRDNTCPAQFSGKILHWIKTVGIDDLSEKRLSTLISGNKITSVTDLYRLKESDLVGLDKIGSKMAAKLVQSISNSKKIGVVKFLAAIGIPGVGETAFKKLFLSAGSGKAILNLKLVDVLALEGFAEKTSTALLDGLVERSGLISELLSLGVCPEFNDEQKIEPSLGGGTLSGKSFVITGELSKPRSHFEALIEAAGGKTSGAVSSKTAAVITNDSDSTSSKMKKAKSLGIPVWSEKDLAVILGL